MRVHTGRMARILRLYSITQALPPKRRVAPDPRARGFHPEDLARLHDERRKGLLGVTPFKNEQRMRRKDGQYRWFLVNYNPLLDDQGRVVRWYATATDIDDRVRAEERTRNENLALRSSPKWADRTRRKHTVSVFAIPQILWHPIGRVYLPIARCVGKIFGGRTSL
ncbi:MAG: PAS domain-containing protein [Candidatus Sulfotelmatobacter sp.]|jgi:hypothetical protein